MGTLLGRANYKELRTVRNSLVEHYGADKISGIHLPWAGNQLLKPSGDKRPIYIVGSATAKDYASRITQNYEASLEYLEKEWRETPRERANTPFWRFLSGLTKHFFGKPHYECVDQWGWSNLFKIAFNEGNEANWPKELFEKQRSACVLALASEFQQLRNALIFIGSSKHLDFVQETLPGKSFDKSYDGDGVYYWSDKDSGNVYVSGYHPRPAIRNKFYDKMLSRTIWLAER